MDNKHRNMKEHTPLAHNIRLLRRAAGLSQEELAAELGIKRSNIAAYENKNVEPRLRVILCIAEFFNIKVRTLIETELRENERYPPFNTPGDLEPVSKSISLNLRKRAEIEAFIDKSQKVRKVLEGFKAFYSFKKDKIVSEMYSKERINFDIENFLQLMEHLLSYNDSVIKSLYKTEWSNN